MTKEQLREIRDRKETMKRRNDDYWRGYMEAVNDLFGEIFDIIQEEEKQKPDKKGT